jgi:cytoskeletal protein CcmA (bactofilin family)
VKAKIEVGTLIVEGHIDGNIKAHQLVELHAPARVRGNIETPSLFIDKGVIFEGNCKMENLGKAAAPAAPKPAPVPPPAAK